MSSENIELVVEQGVAVTVQEKDEQLKIIATSTNKKSDLLISLQNIILRFIAHNQQEIAILILTLYSLI